MSGINSQGTQLLHSGVGSPSTYTKIESVVTITGPSGTLNLIDVSDLDSTGKEYLPGLADRGQIQLACNFRGATKQMDLLTMFAGSLDAEPFQLKIPTDSTRTQFHNFYFSAIVTKWELGAGVDKKADLNITLQVSGGVTYVLA